MDSAALTATPRSIPTAWPVPGAGTGSGTAAKATCQRPARLALLSLAALAIAAAGALLPAGWAARAPPATALRAE